MFWKKLVNKLVNVVRAMDEKREQERKEKFSLKGLIRLLFREPYAYFFLILIVGTICFAKSFYGELGLLGYMQLREYATAVDYFIYRGHIDSFVYSASFIGLGSIVVYPMLRKIMDWGLALKAIFFTFIVTYAVLGGKEFAKDKLEVGFRDEGLVCFDKTAEKCYPVIINHMEQACYFNNRKDKVVCVEKDDSSYEWSYTRAEHLHLRNKKN